MNHIKKISLLMVIFFVGTAKAVVPPKWFYPMDVAMKGESLKEVLLYLSRVTEVSLEIGAGFSDVKVQAMHLKGKSASQILATLAEMYKLTVEPTSKYGYRINFARADFLRRLDLNPSEASIDVIFQNVTSVEVLQTVQQLTGINIIIPTFEFNHRHSIEGTFAPTAVINDVASVEGMSVRQRDGIVYFTKASKP